MQCPNCGVEAININGREICLDCGIEIARGVAKNAAPEEQEISLPSTAPEPTTVEPSTAAEDIGNNELAESVAEEATATQFGSEAEEMQPVQVGLPDGGPNDPAGDTAPNPLISHLGETPKDNIAVETPGSEAQEGIGASEPTVDRLVLDSIEKNDGNLLPPSKQAADLLFDFQKDGDQSSEKEETGQQETPIFADQAVEQPQVPVPTAIPTSTLNEEILEKEAYVEPQVSSSKEETFQAPQAAPAANYSIQVDSINHGSPSFMAPQTSLNSPAESFAGNIQNNFSAPSSDIMPASRVSSKIFRRIAIIMIIIINIIALVLLGVFIKNNYLNVPVETVDEEPVMEF